MKRFAPVFLLIGLTFFLNACGVGTDADDDQQAKDKRDQQKLLETYGPLTGDYAGTITTTTGSFSGHFILFTESASNGYDANGAPLSRTVLRAQMKLDAVGVLDDHFFFVDYKSFDGSATFHQDAPPASGKTSLVAAAPTAGDAGTCSVGEHDSTIAITGALFRGDMLTGTLLKHGAIGQISMKKQQGSNQQPVRDQADRLNAAYAHIVGTFAAKVKTADAEPPLEGQLVIHVGDSTTSSEGVTCPVLQAEMKFNTVGKFSDTSFSASYNDSTGALVLQASGAGSVRCVVGPFDPKMSITGSLVGGEMKNGVMQVTGGAYGTVRLKQTSSGVTTTDDSRERLAKAYGAVAGTYGGRFKGPSNPGPDHPPSEFPVKIDILLSDVDTGAGVRCPVLSAQYSRPDAQGVPGAGLIGLKTNYYPAESTIVFNSTDVQGPHYLLVNGNWSTYGIKADMKWYEYIGKLDVAHCPYTAVDISGRCCLSDETDGHYRCKK